jgi:hypothetical protein
VLAKENFMKSKPKAKTLVKPKPQAKQSLNSRIKALADSMAAGNHVSPADLMALIQ